MFLLLTENFHTGDRVQGSTGGYEYEAMNTSMSTTTSTGTKACLRELHFQII